MKTSVLLLQDNLRLGKKLATGGFGTVFKADLIDDEDPRDVRSVIVKKVCSVHCSILYTCENSLHV